MHHLTCNAKERKISSSSLRVGRSDAVAGALKPPAVGGLPSPWTGTTRSPKLKTEQLRGMVTGGGLTAQRLLYLHLYEHLFKFKTYSALGTKDKIFCLSKAFLMFLSA